MRERPRAIAAARPAEQPPAALAATAVLRLQPSTARLRAAELVGLFFLLPGSLATLTAFGVAVPVVPVLVVIGLAVILLLNRDPHFPGFRALRKHRPSVKPLVELQRILALYTLSLPALIGIVAITGWSNFLAFPQEQTGLWLTICFVYPVFSVIPQELIFRVFFYHRYRALIHSRRGVLYISALSFGLAHLLFGHWSSVLLSGVGGLLFSWTYFRTRSMLWAAGEHALYGVTLFTIGLGRFFYSGS
ncbi:MAG: CPBP family intramembrane glutamic endopeptidase [Planctomycetota bacterium]|jgi:membrane protease YdiL (CAAX protease family)